MSTDFFKFKMYSNRIAQFNGKYVKVELKIVDYNSFWVAIKTDINGRLCNS